MTAVWGCGCTFRFLRGYILLYFIECIGLDLIIGGRRDALVFARVRGGCMGCVHTLSMYKAQCGGPAASQYRWLPDCEKEPINNDRIAKRVSLFSFSLN